jgi:thiol-disulfide isomerase/thioredoxin
MTATRRFASLPVLAAALLALGAFAAPVRSGDAVPAAADKPAETAVKLEPVKFDEFLARMASPKTGKYTLVDVWATWCIPCKENFPHVVEMNAKYGNKGLNVASLSFDDPTKPKQVADAKKFLAEKKAVFPNYLLDEEEGVGNEKLNISAIPAVFIYGPDGKEVKRFTNDDPNDLFTYDDVEKAIVALLDGKPLPEKKKAEKPSGK